MLSIKKHNSALSIFFSISSEKPPQLGSPLFFFTPLHLSIAELLNIIKEIYQLQSNSYLITFKDTDPCGRHLKC